MRTFPLVALCQLEGSQLWCSAAVPMQGAQTCLMESHSPGGNPSPCPVPFQNSGREPGSVCRAKQEIISWCQAEEMAVPVNWRAKLREKKPFLFSNCSMSSEWDWSCGIELAHSQRCPVLRDICFNICTPHRSWQPSVGSESRMPSNEARVLCCTPSHDPVAAYTSRNNILDKLA